MSDKQAWYESLGDHCEVCGRTVLVCLHHTVYEQEIRRSGGDKYDPRVALSVCDKCHKAHHARTKLIPISALKDENLAFAAELLGPQRSVSYLERRYLVDDSRLEEMLTDTKQP